MKINKILEHVITNENFGVDLPLHIDASRFFEQIAEKGQDDVRLGKRKITSRNIVDFVNEYRSDCSNFLSYIKPNSSFEEIPLLNKDFLRSRSNVVINPNIPEKDRWSRYTSGTTGRPVKIIYSSHFYFNFLLDPIRPLLEKCNDNLIDYHNPFFRIAITDNQQVSNEIFIHPLNKTGITLQVVINENEADSINYLFYLIEKYHPECLSIKPSLCEVITRFAYETNLKCRFSPTAIIVSGANLEQDVRNQVLDIFDSDIINVYGMTEFGVIAYECHEKNGFHIDQDRIYYEILENIGISKKNTVSVDVVELVLSSLSNTGMPLIRYKTGDLVEISKGLCSCGNPNDRITKLLGRKAKCFKFKDGTIISPSRFNKMFNLFEYILEFQIIQLDHECVLVRIMDDNSNSFSEEKIMAFIRSQVGEKIKIKISKEQIDYIGKFERYYPLL